MNIKQNELIIGSMMSLATLIVIVGILWLGKSNFFVQGLPINMLVENAAGVSQGDEVYYRGLKIGTVRDAQLADNAILLKLKLEGVSKIPANSKFTIKDYSLVGGKIIEIFPGNSKETLSAGDTVKGFTEQSLTDLLSDFRTLKPQIERVLANIDSLTGKNTLAKINLTATELNRTIRDIRNLINGEIKETFASTKEISSENKEKIASLFNSLSKSAERLKILLNSATNVTVKFDSILTKLNNSKGTLSSLAENDSLYTNLNKAAAAIDSLAKDIKKNPKKYFEVKVF